MCILGETVRRELFGSTDPVGSRIRLGKLTCVVIGLLDAKGESSFGQDQDDLVLVPLRWLQRTLAGNTDVGADLCVGARRRLDDQGQDDLTLLLRERRHSPTGEDDFSIRDMKEIATALTATTPDHDVVARRGRRGEPAGRRDRHHEHHAGVGDRADPRDRHPPRDRRARARGADQFLVEAVVLSSVGGIVGIVLGLAAAAAGTRAIGAPFVFQPGIVVLAFVFSAAVGVIFGFFPARQAARLDPIESPPPRVSATESPSRSGIARSTTGLVVSNRPVFVAAPVSRLMR